MAPEEKTVPLTCNYTNAFCNYLNIWDRVGLSNTYISSRTKKVYQAMVNVFGISEGKKYI
jgi:hypothetical protein